MSSIQQAGGKAGKDSGKSKAKAVSRSARAGLQVNLWILMLLYASYDRHVEVCSDVIALLCFVLRDQIPCFLSYALWILKLNPSSTQIDLRSTSILIVVDFERSIILSKHYGSKIFYISCSFQSVEFTDIWRIERRVMDELEPQLPFIAPPFSNIWLPKYVV